MAIPLKDPDVELSTAYSGDDGGQVADNAERPHACDPAGRFGVS